jgi:uncharacterized protein (DUF885 family)
MGALAAAQLSAQPDDRHPGRTAELHGRRFTASKTAKGAEHYIARLAQFERRLGQALEGVQRRDRAQGILPPTFVVERVLEEMRGFVAVPPRENVLFTTLDGHLEPNWSEPAG